MKFARLFVSFAVGLLFALGLGISGMTQPQRILGFLNPWDWDQTLLFVMMGAVGVHASAYFFLKRRPSPLLDTQWHYSPRSDITGRLLTGAAIFGIGWGLAGYCPGPGLTAMASGDPRALTFVISMILGMLVFLVADKHLPGKG